MLLLLETPVYLDLFLAACSRMKTAHAHATGSKTAVQVEVKHRWRRIACRAKATTPRAALTHQWCVKAALGRTPTAAAITPTATHQQQHNHTQPMQPSTCHPHPNNTHTNTSCLIPSHLVPLLSQLVPVLHQRHQRPRPLPHVDTLVPPTGLLELKPVTKLLQV